MKWIKRLVLVCAAGFGLLVVVAAASYWNHSRQMISLFQQRMTEWKSNGWSRAADYSVAKQALVAAEDPSFLAEPKLGCGLFDLLWGVASANSRTCSPIVAHAAKLAMNDVFAIPRRRWMTEVPVMAELSKDQDEALDIYFNKTYMGKRDDGTPIEGLPAAAEHYYGVRAGQLKVSQAALLAGIVRSPAYYSPKTNPERARERRNKVLDQMAASQFITESEAATAKQE